MLNAGEAAKKSTSTGVGEELLPPRQSLKQMTANSPELASFYSTTGALGKQTDHCAPCESYGACKTGLKIAVNRRAPDMLSGHVPCAKQANPGCVVVDAHNEKVADRKIQKKKEKRSAGKQVHGNPVANVPLSHNPVVALDPTPSGVEKKVAQKSFQTKNVKIQSRPQWRNFFHESGAVSTTDTSGCSVTSRTATHVKKTARCSTGHDFCKYVIGTFLSGAALIGFVRHHYNTNLPSDEDGDEQHGAFSMMQLKAGWDDLQKQIPLDRNRIMYVGAGFAAIETPGLQSFVEHITIEGNEFFTDREWRAGAGEHLDSHRPPSKLKLGALLGVQWFDHPRQETRVYDGFEFVKLKKTNIGVEKIWNEIKEIGAGKKHRHAQLWFDRGVDELGQSILPIQREAFLRLTGIFHEKDKEFALFAITPDFPWFLRVRLETSTEYNRRHGRSSSLCTEIAYRFQDLFDSKTISDKQVVVGEHWDVGMPQEWVVYVRDRDLKKGCPLFYLRRSVVSGCHKLTVELPKRATRDFNFGTPSRYFGRFKKGGGPDFMEHPEQLPSMCNMLEALVGPEGILKMSGDREQGDSIQNLWAIVRSSEKIKYEHSESANCPDEMKETCRDVIAGMAKKYKNSCPSGDSGTWNFEAFQLNQLRILEQNNGEWEATNTWTPPALHLGSFLQITGETRVTPEIETFSYLSATAILSCVCGFSLCVLFAAWWCWKKRESARRTYACHN